MRKIILLVSVLVLLSSACSFASLMPTQTPVPSTPTVVTSALSRTATITLTPTPTVTPTPDPHQARLEIADALKDELAVEIFGEDATPEQIADAMHVIEVADGGVEIQMEQRRYHYGPDYDYWIPIDPRAVAIIKDNMAIKVSQGQIVNLNTGEVVILPEYAGNIYWMKDYPGSDEIPAGIYAVTRDGFVMTVYRDSSWQKVEQGLIAFPEMQVIQPETIVALLPELVMGGKAEVDPSVQHQAWLYWLDKSIANSPANTDFMRSLGITVSNRQSRLDQLVCYLENNKYVLPAGLQLITSSVDSYYYKFRKVDQKMKIENITVNLLTPEQYFTEYLNNNLNNFIGITDGSTVHKYRIRNQQGRFELLFSQSTEFEKWKERHIQDKEASYFFSIGNFENFEKSNVIELNKVIEFFIYVSSNQLQEGGVFWVWEIERWDLKTPEINLIRLK